MMPRLSGWKVASALLADEATEHIPIIFITARGVSDRIRAFELAAHAYLTKPFDPASSVAGVLVRRSGLGRRGHRAAAPRCTAQGDRALHALGLVAVDRAVDLVGSG